MTERKEQAPAWGKNASMSLPDIPAPAAATNDTPAEIHLVAAIAEKYSVSHDKARGWLVRTFRG